MTVEQRPGRLARLVDSSQFNGAIAAVIVANAVVLGLETYPGIRADYDTLLARLNLACYLIFVVELILRLASYGRRPQDFFRNGWNVFDFVIITAAALPVIREQTQLLRLLRLARVARLVRFLPEARLLIVSVARAIPSAFSMLVLTFLLLFVYGMTGWALFGEELPESWGTIGQAMLTLFILLTLENFPTYLSDAQAVSPFATVFFLSYVLLGAFIVFNLFIGIVIGSMEKAREEQAAEAIAHPPADVLVRIAEIRRALNALEQDFAGHHRPSDNEST